MSVAEIEIKDIGAVEQLVLKCPRQGGVLVLSGGNGVGKSTTINAVQSLIDGKTRLPKRDGAARGMVDGCGVLISVSGRTVRNGELAVESIEGKYDINQLVDPGIDKPESADAERIKNLLRLTGVKADKKLFDECVGGDQGWAELIGPDATKTEDLVVMAGRIKRDLQGKALAEEQAAENLAQESKVKKGAAGEVDMTLAQKDETELTKALAAAVHRHAALLELRDHARATQLRASDARANLDRVIREYRGMSVADAERLVDRAESSVGDLAEQLAALQKRLDTAKNELDAARVELRVAKDHERAVEGWRETIASSEAQCPADEEIARAQVDADRAKRELTDFNLARGAYDKLCQAEQLAEEARVHANRAADLRARAAKVDQVLSAAVNCPELIIDDGRIYTTTDRGKELFAELSPGERAEMAMNIAISALSRQVKPGELALLPLAQEFWAALDNDRKAAIASKLQGTGIVAITAECTSGPLQVEEFTGG